MTDLDAVDYFTDPAMVPDPHLYFEYLRAQGPVVREPHHGVVAVTGYDEAMALYKDVESYSSCIAVGGPFPSLPFEPSGEDITGQIEAHRTQMPLHEHMVTMDRRNHTRARSIVSRLLTPARLKDNQDFLGDWPISNSTSSSSTANASSSRPTPSPTPCSPSRTCSEFPKRTTKNSVPCWRIHTRWATSITTQPRSTRWNSSTRSSAATSKTDAASRAAMCSVIWRRRSFLTAQHRKLSRSCGPLHSCSVPGRRRRRNYWAQPCKSSVTHRISSRDCARTAASSRLHRRNAANGKPRQDHIPPSAQVNSHRRH